MTKVRMITAALACTSLMTAACHDDTSPTDPIPAASLDAASAHQGAAVGTTAGWSDGSTVTFHYNRPFFCQSPPSSGATTSCELGAESVTPPRGGGIPTLYVIVPLVAVDPATLQCPVPGSCINHPSTIDLSRVFGAGTENALLPAHSHIIGDEGTPKGANGGWWDIEVIAVKDLDTWNAIAAGKSLATVRSLQAADPAGARITPDVPTNLYLFFNVRPK